MIEMEVRDEDGVDFAQEARVHLDDTTKMYDPRPKQRVGQQANAVHVDQHGRVSDVENAGRHEIGIV